MARSWLDRRPHRRTLLVCLLGVACAGLALMASSRSGTEDLPEPNGIDALILAGSEIRGDWPNKGQLPEADPVELSAFVDRNREALASARTALGLEARVYFPNTEAGLADQAAVHRRLLLVARLLAAEHFASAAEGRVEAAWRSDVNALRVGQAGTQGGMLAHASMSWSLQGYAIDRLRSLRGRLTSADCRAIIADLDALDRRRVDPQALVARWQRWYSGAFDLPSRTMLWVSGAQAIERENQRNRSRLASDKIARSFRFLMAELAIHACTLDRKSPPRAFADLVPDYLPRIPIDPATGRPIDYPKTPDGRLAEDLGGVGQPEGQAGPPAPA